MNGEISQIDVARHVDSLWRNRLPAHHEGRCRTQRKTEFSRDIIRGSSVSHRADDRQASDLLTEALSVIQVGWE
jgi:hypothetical protein